MAAAEGCECFAPGRLWSLWEIMQTLDLGRLLSALGTITSLNQGLEDAANAALTGLNFKDFRLLRRDYDAAVEHCEYLHQIGKVMELAAALATVENFTLALQRADLNSVPGEAIFAKFDVIAMRGAPAAIGATFRDSLKAHEVLTLASSKSAYFKQTAPLLGSKVQAKFPSAIYDISEAGKCYALERSTATAFHAIRCLEAGIRALSRCLGIQDPTRASDRNWGAMLKILKDKIDLRWPGSSTRLSGDGEFFDNAYAALAAMQNPWRNATMHLDQKYTEEEALNVIEVVKGFMSRLASRMDENGLPLA